MPDSGDLISRRCEAVARARLTSGPACSGALLAIRALGCAPVRAPVGREGLGRQWYTSGSFTGAEEFYRGTIIVFDDPAEPESLAFPSGRRLMARPSRGMVGSSIRAPKGAPLRDIRSYKDQALRKGLLIRKSFEYRVSPDDAEEVSRLSYLHILASPSSRDSAEASLNAYWAQEHALAQLARHRYGMSYLEYLPGRVYTYRVLLNRLLETVDVRSIVDVGCGSGMALHEAVRHGITASGIDVSVNALSFARYLGSEFGSRNLTLVHANALRNWRPPLVRADVVSNLGSLEHLPVEDQLKFARFMGRLSRKYVLVSVPNYRSPLFARMEAVELGLKDQRLVYPEEYQHYDVDFRRIADTLGWTLICGSCVHVASTSLTQKEMRLRPLLSKVRETHLSDCPSCDGLMECWLQVETSCSNDLLNDLGWFKFAIFSTA